MADGAAHSPSPRPAVCPAVAFRLTTLRYTGLMTTLYGLTTCDTCKKARKWLQQAGIAHVFVDVRNAPVPPRTLSEWADRRGGFAALVNKSSTTWRQLPEARKTPADDAEWLTLPHEFPALLRRPVVVMDDGRVQQGFSAAAFSTLFGVSA